MFKQTDTAAPEEQKSLKRTTSSRQRQRAIERAAEGLDTTDANPEISKKDVKDMKAAIEIENLYVRHGFCTTVSHLRFL